jgi:hypothetical protein
VLVVLMCLAGILRSPDHPTGDLRLNGIVLELHERGIRAV